MTTRPVLEAKNLSKSVSVNQQSLSILANLDLAVAPGESVAVLGASGSGKSTLLGLLAGLDVPSSGTVLLDGTDLFNLNEDARAALRGEMLGFVFQSFQLLPAFSALENVMLPLELKKIPAARARAARALERVGLAERLHQTPRTLSGGEQQRVALARAFATEPRILFADEPTGNLDSATGERIARLLFELNAEHRTTLILVTHDAGLAQRCERRYRLHGGRLEAWSEASEAHA